MDYLNPLVLLDDLVSSFECKSLFCNGGVPTQGLFDNLRLSLATDQLSKPLFDPVLLYLYRTYRYKNLC